MAGFLLGLLSVTLSSCDQFGLDTALSAGTEQAIQTIRAPFYGALQTDVQNDIAVVLFDDESYEQYGWPIDFPRLEELVGAFAQQRPKAVFIDLVLGLPRDVLRVDVDSSNVPRSETVGGERQEAMFDDYFCEFADALLTLTGREPDAWLQEVLYGKTDETSNGNRQPKRDCIRQAMSRDEALEEKLKETRIPAELRSHIAYRTINDRLPDTNHIPVLIGAERSYLLEPAPDRRDKRWARYAILDRVATLVPLDAGTGDSMGYRLRITRHDFLTPAPLLAMTVGCQHDGDAPVCGHPNAENLVMDFTSLPESMRLLWGGISAKGQPPMGDGQCVTPWQRLGFAMGDLFYGPAQGTTIGRYFSTAKCPYHYTVRYCQMDPEFPCSGQSEQQSVLSALTGKFVFFGVDVKIIDDSIDAPMRGRVAAVYAHAMALDNLLTLRRPQLHPQDLPSADAVNALMQFILAWAAVSVMLFARESAKTGSYRWPKVLLRESPRRGFVLGLAMTAFSAIGLAGVSHFTMNHDLSYWSRTGDFFAVMMLAFLFGLGLIGTVVCFRVIRRGEAGYRQIGLRAGRVLEHLAPQALIAAVTGLTGMFLATGVSVLFAWPPANFLSTYILVFATQLVIFRDSFRNAAIQGLFGTSSGHLI